MSDQSADDRRDYNNRYEEVNKPFRLDSRAHIMTIIFKSMLATSMPVQPTLFRVLLALNICISGTSISKIAEESGLIYWYGTYQSHVIFTGHIIT